MRFEEHYLTEKYFDTRKYKSSFKKDGYVEIFKNPSLKEINEVIAQSQYNEVRISYMKNGDVLIWNADITHNELLENNPDLMENTLDTYYFSKNTFRMHKDRYRDFGRDLTEDQQRKILEKLEKYFPMAEIIPNLIFRYSNIILGEPNKTGNI